MTEYTRGLHRIVTFPAIYEAIQAVLGGPESRRRIAMAVLSGLEGRSVVEIGCGPGTWSAFLTNTAHYLGVDYNARHIESALRHFGTEHTQFYCGDIADPQVIGQIGKVDCVVGIGILHHLDDDIARTMLDNIKSILGFGGEFVGIEPVYHRHQNPIARLLNHLDSGRNIRTEQGYRSLFGANMAIKTEIRKDMLRVPYSHCIIRALIS